MTPELKTCLDYCDHGEGTGLDGTGTPYLPTLRRLIVNAVNAEVTEYKRQVATLEEYMLKGVTFRDELQARIRELDEKIKRDKYGKAIGKDSYPDSAACLDGKYGPRR